MKNLLSVKIGLPLLLAGWMLSSCSFKYSFTGAGTIDYTKVRSVSIKDFPNVAPLVYAPLSQQFTEKLKDKYTRQTKLQVLRDGGDLDLEGEITGYNYTSMAVTDGQYASQTRLTITVRVRYTNNANPDDDFEKSFSAHAEFGNDQMIDQVQDQLSDGIMDEIIDQIFNETIAKW